MYIIVSFPCVFIYKTNTWYTPFFNGFAFCDGERSQGPTVC